jgi:predicted Fe-Mo cluster-binding NifX family protein
MKIAIITDNEKSISQHFGRASYYLVITLEGGKEVSRELRPKLGHNQFQAGNAHIEHEHAGHGLDDASHQKHTSMAEVIGDCSVVICGGMGMGAYESMQRLKIQPIVTDLRDIDSAIQAYLSGTLTDHTEKLH